MNESIASIVRDRLLEDTKKNAGRYYKPISNLEKALEELSNRRKNPLPPSLPRQAEDTIPILRKYFRDNVTFISLVLHHHFPDRYLFYRVSTLEQEIFTGFNFLKAVVPGFDFRFSKVGGTGLSRYLQLNEALLAFARAHWPRDRDPQKKLTYFLYQGLGRLFQEKAAYNRYWVVAAKPENCEDLDYGARIVDWSVRKEVQPGDLVFLYRTSPRKAITDILQVKTEPVFDPWGAWHGFWANLTRICSIDDIPFAEMQRDPVLGEWGIVKKKFVGTVTEPVPYVAYNQLVKKISSEVQARYKLEPEEVTKPVSPSEPPEGLRKFSQLPTLATPEYSGRFALEAEFEEKVVVPLLKKRWNFKHHAQYGCPVWIGSQQHQLWVDFLVSDDERPLTLFEDKLRFINDEDLKSAVGQAKSYALLLGLSSFVVASPEGMWLYALDGNQERLEEPISQLKARSQQEAEFRERLLKLRVGRTGNQQPPY